MITPCRFPGSAAGKKNAVIPVQDHGLLKYNKQLTAILLDSGCCCETKINSNILEHHYENYIC